MSEYGKLESIRIKGIAIICMYVLHFFAHPDWILAENMYRTLTPWGAVILPMLSNFGHICVALFAFTSGYAMYIQREKYAHLQYRICKCFTFLIQYWFVIAAFMLYGFLAGETMPDIPTFLMQSVGIGTDIYAQGLNVCTAWYVFFFLVFVLLHPILIKLSVKNFVIDSFLTFIVLYGGAIIVTKQPFIDIPHTISRFFERFGLWGSIGLIGYLFAKYQIFKQVNGYLNKKISTAILVFLSVAIIPTMMIIRSICGNIAITDIIYAPILIYAVNILLNQIRQPWIESCLKILAKYSMYMWFLHSIFFTPNNSLQWLAYWPKYPFLILIWTLFLTLSISKVFHECYTQLESLFRKIK